jgi:hypothetical protein
MPTGALTVRERKPTERTGAELSTQTMRTESLVPISDAAQRLGRSVWTLKRRHAEGHLPAVIDGGRWLIPESFIAGVLGSARPKQAGTIESAAREWFAAHATGAVA